MKLEPADETDAMTEDLLKVLDRFNAWRRSNDSNDSMDAIGDTASRKLVYGEALESIRCLSPKMHLSMNLFGNPSGNLSGNSSRNSSRNSSANSSVNLPPPAASRPAPIHLVPPRTRPSSVPVSSADVHVTDTVTNRAAVFAPALRSAVFLLPGQKQAPSPAGAVEASTGEASAVRSGAHSSGEPSPIAFKPAPETRLRLSRRSKTRATSQAPSRRRPRSAKATQLKPKAPESSAAVSAYLRRCAFDVEGLIRITDEVRARLELAPTDSRTQPCVPRIEARKFAGHALIAATANG